MEDWLLVFSSIYGLSSALLFIITKLVFSWKSSYRERYQDSVRIFVFTLLATSFFINLYKGLSIEEIKLDNVPIDFIFVIVQITVFFLAPIKFMKEYEGIFHVDLRIMFYLIGFFTFSFLLTLMNLLDLPIFLVFNLSNFIFLALWFSNWYFQEKLKMRR